MRCFGGGGNGRYLMGESCLSFRAPYAGSTCSAPLTRHVMAVRGEGLTARSSSVESSKALRLRSRPSRADQRPLHRIEPTIDQQRSASDKRRVVAGEVQRVLGHVLRRGPLAPGGGFHHLGGGGGILEVGDALRGLHDCLSASLSSSARCHGYIGGWICSHPGQSALHGILSLA